MRIIAYLFKTDGEPYSFTLRDNESGNLMRVFVINPNRKEYTEGYEMHGRRIHQLFIDPSFQTASWLWEYYMPALHSTGAIIYNFIETN